MAPRLKLQSLDHYLGVARKRLADGAQGTGLAIALLVVGALGVVIFLMVALLSRSWGFSFTGMLLSLAIAAGGVWVLIRPD